MAGSTFIQVPHDLNNPVTLKRFLSKLVLQLDIAFGNRGNNNFVSTSSTTFSQVSSLQDLINTLNREILNLEPIIEPKGTAFNKNFGSSSGTITEGGTTTNNPTQVAISDLNQTISAAYVQSEVQAISDKLDVLLAALRSSNIIEV